MVFVGGFGPTLHSFSIDLREDLVAIDEALTRLATIAERAATVVQLRYFGGLSVEETAQYMGVAPSHRQAGLGFRACWLHRQLAGESNVTGAR